LEPKELKQLVLDEKAHFDKLAYEEEMNRQRKAEALAEQEEKRKEAEREEERHIKLRELALENKKDNERKANETRMIPLIDCFYYLLIYLFIYLFIFGIIMYCPTFFFFLSSFFRGIQFCDVRSMLSR
jgi:uncharacterized membrane protein